MKNQAHKQDPPVDPTLRVNPESKALIHSVMVNTTMASMLYGYMLAYFNAVDFHQIMVIMNIQMDPAAGKGLLTGSIPLMAALGAWMSSLFLKKLSRKTCFYAMNVICIIATLMIQTKIFELFFLGRFLQGFYVGMQSTFVPLYVKEFVPQMNGKYGMYHQLFISLGVTWGFLFNFILMHIFGDLQNYWRLQFIFPVVVASIQLFRICTKYPYETPKYLVSKERIEDARQLLRLLYKPEHVEQQLQSLKVAVAKAHAVAPQQQLQVQQTLMQIELDQMGDKQEEMQQRLLNRNIDKPIKAGNKTVQPANCFATLCGLHLATFQQMSGYAIVISYSGDIAKLVIPQFYHEFPILVQGMGVVVLYPALKAVKKYGRVTMLQGGGFVICGLLSLITVCFLFDRGSMVSISLILISLVLIKMAYAATLGSVLWLYLAEIVKPTIYPYCVMTNWLTYTTLAAIFPIVVKVFGNPGYAFGIAAAYTGYSIFMNFIILVQTKGKNQATIKKEIAQRYQAIKQKGCCS